MAIEQLSKPCYFGEVEVKGVSVGATGMIKTEYSSIASLTFVTPNVAEVVSGRTTELYVREAIQFKAWLTGWENLIGAERLYRWVQGDPEEDIKYRARENELLNHPLVGQEVLFYIGTEIHGISRRLLGGGFRAEGRRREIDPRLGVRSSNHYIPTDAKWTRAMVEEGRGENVIELDGLNPGELKIRVLEGKHEGEKHRVLKSNLRAPLQGTDRRIERILRGARIRGSFTAEETRFLESGGFDLSNLLCYLLLTSETPGSHSNGPETIADRPFYDDVRGSWHQESGGGFRTEPFEQSDRGLHSSETWHDSPQYDYHSSDHGGSDHGGSDYGGSSYGGSDSGGSDSGGGD